MLELGNPASLVEDYQRGYWKLTAPLQIEFGGAADASGEFRLNDYITSVNGVSTENFRLRYDLVNYMIITSNDEDTVKFGLKSINEVSIFLRFTLVYQCVSLNIFFFTAAPFFCKIVW